uniref:Metalloendopeptidase n=1 Tax=Parastrongyloides trichosuri TaxID=131310 RepID=A0A0N4ZD85_PARTI
MSTFLFLSFVLNFVFLNIIISSYELNHSTANDNITINISREINFVKKREILVNKWGNWTLPIKYYISSKYMLYSENIQNALNNIQNLTCLNFTKADKLDPGEEGLKFVHDYGICGSYVGKSSYSFPHVVYLTTGCSETIGSIQHEIFHALGVQHTHSRSDRDKYIEIKKENFLEYEDFEENILEKNNKNNYKSYNTLYDFNSILHYKNDAWSKNGKKTIVAKSIKLYDNMMGQREKLSFMDVKLINGYYCSDKCKENVIKCKNGGYKHWSNCNICVCPKGYVGNTCNSVEPLDRECSNINLKAQNFYKKIHVTGIKKCNFLIKATGNKKILLVFTVVYS